MSEAAQALEESDPFNVLTLSIFRIIATKGIDSELRGPNRFKTITKSEANKDSWSNLC